MTYSNSISLNKDRYSARNQNTTSFKTNEKVLGPISNAIILVVLACVLGLLYLTQVTKTNSYGYKLNALTSQASTLQQEHDDLEVSSARLQALERVKNSEPAKSLVSVVPSGTLTN